MSSKYGSHDGFQNMEGKFKCLMCHIFIDMNMSVKELCFLLVEQKIDIYLLEKRIILASEVIIPSVQP